ncbi:hypothetical protein GCK72_017010 [Caenorhabditis remanei]|uniref:RING-type domain-containing protein n=1 Tax=Caenorhabditis remanei TaxID=31234 RepID=A0A6A5G643_CAERE|nr:hypothetical protein GCK72_017010 [Caenorhabditis remanei]KAF1750460.1 hypothetical protein GCK72_017010 [Caenorhabditis remanei]
MTLLHNCDYFSWEAAWSGFHRHMLMILASVFNIVAGGPRDLTRFFTSLKFLIFAFIILQFVLKIFEDLAQRDMFDHVRRCYKTGFFGVLVCAIAPYVASAIYGVASEEAFLTFHTCSFASFFIYISFMLPNTYAIIWSVEDKHRVIAGYLPSVVQSILVVFLFPVWYFEVWIGKYPVVYLQIMYTAVHIIILSDLLIVCVIERLEDEEEDTIVEIIDSDDEDVEDNGCFDQETNDLRYQDLKCSICKLFYHESIEKRIPKMLSCGHTFCSGCAKMLHKGDYYDSFKCPICSKRTFLDDLKKNYALLDLIQEIKQDKKTVQRRRSFS